MPVYEVIVNGENYLMNVEDEGLKKMGFYVTRYVRADDVDLAAAAALDKVRRIERLKGVACNAERDPPRLGIEEVYEIDAYPARDQLEPGIILYSEEDEEETDEVSAVEIVEVEDERKA